MSLVKLCKGKNLIMSSEANNILYQRSPQDCQVMCEAVFGMTNAQDRIATVRQNCMNSFKHAHLRRTFKGVAEIVVPESKNEKKLDDEEMKSE